LKQEATMLCGLIVCKKLTELSISLKNQQPRNRTQRFVKVTRNAIKFIEKLNELFEQ